MGNKVSYIIKFFHLDTSKQLSIIYFVLLLFQVKFLVKFVPLKYYYKEIFQLEWNHKIDMQRYYRIFSLFKKVVRKIPFQITCLEESIAIQLYFRKLRIDLPVYLGIKTDNNGTLMAHAWSFFEDSQVNNFKRIN